MTQLLPWATCSNASQPVQWRNCSLYPTYTSPGTTSDHFLFYYMLPGRRDDAPPRQNVLWGNCRENLVVESHRENICPPVPECRETACKFQWDFSNIDKTKMIQKKTYLTLSDTVLDRPQKTCVLLYPHFLMFQLKGTVNESGVQT